MLHNYHMYAVERASPVECSRDSQHYLHVGVVSLGGAAKTMDVASGSVQTTPLIQVERYIKGPWPYNGEQSAMRLRNPVEFDTRDVSVLGNFTSRFGIDWAIQFPMIDETTITVVNKELSIPYDHGEGEELLFATDAKSFMMAAMSALGLHRIMTAN